MLFFSSLSSCSILHSTSNSLSVTSAAPRGFSAGSGRGRTDNPFGCLRTFRTRRSDCKEELQCSCSCPDIPYISSLCGEISSETTETRGLILETARRWWIKKQKTKPRFWRESHLRFEGCWRSKVLSDRFSSRPWPQAELHMTRFIALE